MFSYHSLSTNTGRLSFRTFFLFFGRLFFIIRHSVYVCSRGCGRRWDVGSFPLISRSLRLLLCGDGVFSSLGHLFLGICLGCSDRRDLCYFLFWISRFCLFIRMLYDYWPKYKKKITKAYTVISLPNREGPSRAFFNFSWYSFYYSVKRAFCCWKAIGSGGATVGLWLLCSYASCANLSETKFSTKSTNLVPNANSLTWITPL